MNKRKLPLGIDHKNRFSDVLPGMLSVYRAIGNNTIGQVYCILYSASHSRVQIYTDSESCYINANFVRVSYER